MTSAAFVIPGNIDLPTGGYAYDRRVLTLLGQHGVASTHVALPGSYPEPTPEHVAETESVLAAVPQATTLLFDGLAFGALHGDVIGRIKQNIVALVHHPLCLEAGLSPMRQRYLKQTETMALAFAEHVVVTSHVTARILSADFQVSPDRLTVAEPGTDRAARAVGTQAVDANAPVQLLAVGSIVQRKGYDMLMHALAPLVHLNWQLTITGAARDPAALAALTAACKAGGLQQKVTVAGAVTDSQLQQLYATADVFVMPSHFEGYGMVLAEAMARGLPIVCTTGGAAAETAPDAAAIKVRPGDATGFGAAVDALISDRSARLQRAEASWTAGQTLPTWDNTARVIASVLKRVHG
jgi:glycosyltransferase involved in cell wall biosynthesis